MSSLLPHAAVIHIEDAATHAKLANHSEQLCSSLALRAVVCCQVVICAEFPTVARLIELSVEIRT